MALKNRLLASTAITLPALMSASMAMSADLTPVMRVPSPTLELYPAVSALNGKFDLAFGGSTPGYDIFGDTGSFQGAIRGQGAISVPIGTNFGLQFDGVAASIQGNFFGHGAAHLFWRDPRSFLLGGYAAYSTYDGVDRTRVAVEGEAYLGRFSIESITGWESGDVPSHFFTITDLAFYPHDNLRASIGFRNNSAGSSLAAGVEYQFASTPTHAWTGFVDAEFGNNNYQKVFLGIRLHFGKDKSLIRRHREDDPQIKADERSLTACTHAGAIVSDGVNDSSVLVDGFLGTVPCNKSFPTYSGET